MVAAPSALACACTLQVWKKEQEAAEEAKKLEEIRKQYEDERKVEEMMGEAARAGYSKA